ncbi:hypothetical protein GCM10009595_08610 [Falsarthrobacter nasiphocae]
MRTALLASSTLLLAEWLERNVRVAAAGLHAPLGVATALARAAEFLLMILAARMLVGGPPEGCRPRGGLGGGDGGLLGGPGPPRTPLAERGQPRSGHPIIGIMRP